MVFHVSKHRAEREKAERNLIYAKKYRQLRCEKCGHRSSVPGRCRSCGESIKPDDYAKAMRRPKGGS